MQALLKSSTNGRRIKYSESGAVLQGKLYDDKGNRMGPSFSSKNGVRYRFYVSAALRGRKEKAGSVPRIPAPEIEAIVDNAVRERLKDQGASKEALFGQIERVVLREDRIDVTLNSQDKKEFAPAESIVIPWARTEPSRATVSGLLPAEQPDQKLLQGVVRAHAWLNDLTTGRHSSIENLARAAKLHPKVVRQGLRIPRAY